MNYTEFLETKQKGIVNSGFDISEKDLNNHLFLFQKFITRRALKAGKYALFEDCGLGKTIQHLEWAHREAIHTGKPVLILCPLAVSGQTIQEGENVFRNCESKTGSMDPEDIQVCIIRLHYASEHIDCSISLRYCFG